MQAMRDASGGGTPGRLWRSGLAALILLGPLAVLLSMAPITDPPSYHDFADRRAFLGIPNFLDVASSIPYSLLGIAGVLAVFRTQPPGARAAWAVFFTGVALVGLGSAYYHWIPSGDTLVWDRLPMAIGFAALAVAILRDYVSPKLGLLLAPAVLGGLASVIYGHGHEDLRLYAWVQALPLLAICAAVVLYRPAFTHRGYLLAAFGGYVLAKLAELHDVQWFLLTDGIVSGHTLKHLIGAVVVWALLRMVKIRRPLAAAPDFR